MDRVIIIGTGVFGLSTADHIHQKWPTTQLSVVSRPSPFAPSDDISKIVRVDYSNVERMTEAVEAQKQWNSDTKFSRYQSRIGRVVIYEQDDTAAAQKINGVREELGLPRRELGDSTLMKNTFGTTTAPDSLTYVLAPDDSIVDWGPCISDARERAKDACASSGGTFHESGVASLVKDGSCITSLVLENGETVETGGAQIVLAVGPWLAQILDSSGIPLPPNGRTPVATGLFSYHVRLNEEQTEFFKDKPMISHKGQGRCSSARSFFPLADYYFRLKRTFFLHLKAVSVRLRAQNPSPICVVLLSRVSRISPKALLRNGTCTKRSNGPGNYSRPSREHTSPLSHLTG
jgi:glycine/D-amino acid oxidase-like deaminating enzyme